MIDAIKIHNFKIHKDLDLEFKNLNLLVGLNSSGKSSVIQGLLLLLQNHKNGQLRSGLGLNGNLCNIGFISDALCQYADEDAGKEYIEFSVRNNGRVFSWKFAPQNRNLEVDYIPLVSEPVEDTDFTSGNVQYISAARLAPQESYPFRTNEVANLKQISLDKGKCELVVHFLYHYGKEKKFQINHALSYSPATSLDLIDQVSAWEGVISSNVNIVPQLEGKAFSLKYSYNKPGDIVPSKEFSATNVGFGLSYALPIIVAVLTAQPGDLIIIENPEAHLHPSGQAEMIRLISMAAQTGVQFIIETHSDHIINGLLVATKRFEETGKDGVDKALTNIYSFHKNQNTQTSDYEPINIIGDGKIDRQPEGFVEQTTKDLSYLLGF